MSAILLGKTRIPTSNGKYITVSTFETRMPKVVLPQFATHRNFSKSASSARAIPGRKYRKLLTGWMPEAFPKNAKGMSPSKLLVGAHEFMAKLLWKSLYYITCVFHQLFIWLGVHKEIANRLLDAFAYINIIVSTTYLKNFFALRIEDNAQDQIEEVAKDMKVAFDSKKAVVRHIHLPLIENDDIDDIFDDPSTHILSKEKQTLLRLSIYNLILGKGSHSIRDYKSIPARIYMLLIMINTCKTARGSYLNHYQPRTLAANKEFYEDLVVSKPIHASPAESCAMSKELYKYLVRKDSTVKKWHLHRRNPAELHGNFKPGVVQFRKIIEDIYEE